MIISCFPTGIVNLKRPSQGVADIVNAGFTNVLLDINMCCSEGIMEIFGKKEKSSASAEQMRILEDPEQLHTSFEQFLQTVRENHLHISAAYAPHLMRSTKRSDLRELLIRMTEESIRLCKEAGCRYLVVRPLFAGVTSGNGWDENREYYLHFAKMAQENDVMILLENQCRDIGGHLVRGICSDSRVAADWIDMLNEVCGEERFGFCMNSGICNLCGQDMSEFAKVLGERIKMVILCDNDGHHETLMLPFTCVSHGQSQTDWLNLIRGLREIEFDGQLVLAHTDTVRAFSPLLRPQILAMSKSVADYFKWQIEMESFLKKYPSRVLFGAGNMCRNYMKCYGEKYPPLFTCDNNKALWGTSFCGLEVKSPEALKEIAPDCAVFLCNIYYREIEEQLRQMGIENPIEFFNDEYMPSFYFDRLEERRQ